MDSLSCFFLLTVAGVTLLAALGSVAYLSAEEDAGRLSAFQVRLYFIFFGLFASLMLASLETGNLGLLFVLIEASTLASAALVGLEGARQLAGGGLEVRDHQLVRRHDRAGRARCSCIYSASAPAPGRPITG